MAQYVEIENTAAQYLEFMIHGFMNGLITLQELEASATPVQFRHRCTSPAGLRPLPA